MMDYIIKNIVMTSKRKNKVRAITGVLFYENHRYVQIIEGEKEQLLILMDELHKDSRHEQIKELINEPIPEREFKDWNMDYFNIDKNNELTESVLLKFRDIYKHNLMMSSEAFIDFIKGMLADPELKKIMNT